MHKRHGLSGNGNVYQALARGRWQPSLARLTVRR